MIEMNDDDWELFVPVKGDKYPDVYEVRERSSSLRWRKGSVPRAVVYDPENHLFEYRKPKQKGNKMLDRTPQQALKDAIGSGAVDAWINGGDVEWSHTYEEDWISHKGSGFGPCWMDDTIKWRPKPPEPTKINWRPVVTGKEPKGWVLGVFGDIKHYVVTLNFTDAGNWFTPEGLRVDCPTHWAPMCNLPEGEK